MRDADGTGASGDDRAGGRGRPDKYTCRHARRSWPCLANTFAVFQPMDGDKPFRRSLDVRVRLLLHGHRRRTHGQSFSQDRGVGFGSLICLRMLRRSSSKQQFKKTHDTPCLQESTGYWILASGSTAQKVSRRVSVWSLAAVGLCRPALLPWTGTRGIERRTRVRFNTSGNLGI